MSTHVAQGRAADLLRKFPGVTEPREQHPRGPRHPWHRDAYAQADYCGRCCVYLSDEVAA